MIVGLSPALHHELQEDAARGLKVEMWKTQLGYDIRWIRFVGLSNGLVELDSNEDADSLSESLTTLEGVQYAEPDLMMRAR